MACHGGVRAMDHGGMMVCATPSAKVDLYIPGYRYSSTRVRNIPYNSNIDARVIPGHHGTQVPKYSRERGTASDQAGSRSYRIT